MGLLFHPWLTTLNHIRQHRRLQAAETGDDPLLMDFIAEASTEFIEALGRIPMPYVDSKRFGAANLDNSLDLKLREDLLEVTSITNGDGSTIASGYNLRPDNSYPKDTIELISNGSAYWRLIYREDRIAVPGIWGYVPHYAQNAWSASGINLPTGGLNSSVTSLVLAGGQGVTFETGQYIKVESETCQITAITGDTLTLSRGELGTTAAAHVAGVAISIFRQLADIKGAVREMVAYKYKTKDKNGGRVTVYEGGTIQVNDIDPQVEKTRQSHLRRKAIRAV